MFARFGYSRLALVLGFLFPIILSTLPAAAATIKTQAPCVGPSGYCLSFGAADPIPTIRGFTFVAPSIGTAEVTFHGSLFCAVSSTFNSRMDLVSQIVNAASLTPDLTKPGSLRHAAGLVVNVTHQWSTTFNLASTRTFAITSAGSKSYYFKIARLLQDAGMTCYVYNATFSIVFVP
jgi:hypothetical protein